MPITLADSAVFVLVLAQAPGRRDDGGLPHVTLINDRHWPVRDGAGQRLDEMSRRASIRVSSVPGLWHPEVVRDLPLKCWPPAS
jgi:hypothetical protein